MQELEKSELPKNDKYKFLNDIYDDFFYLISSNTDGFDSEKVNAEKDFPKIHVEEKN